MVRRPDSNRSGLGLRPGGVVEVRSNFGHFLSVFRTKRPRSPLRFRASFVPRVDTIVTPSGIPG